MTDSNVIPFERRANFNTHTWEGTDDVRCTKCDARPTSLDAVFACGQTTFGELEVDFSDEPDPEPKPDYSTDDLAELASRMLESGATAEDIVYAMAKPWKFWGDFPETTEEF